MPPIENNAGESLAGEKPAEPQSPWALAALHERRKRRHSLFGGLIFTILLLGSIALAIRQTYPAIAASAVGAVLLLVVVFHYALKASSFFGVTFANSVGARPVNQT